VLLDVLKLEDLLEKSVAELLLKVEGAQQGVLLVLAVLVGVLLHGYRGHYPRFNS